MIEVHVKFVDEMARLPGRMIGVGWCASLWRGDKMLWVQSADSEDEARTYALNRLANLERPL